MIFGARRGRGNCRTVAFPVVTWHLPPLPRQAVSPGRKGVSAVHGWRPQQDSNLRTRLRRPLRRQEHATALSWAKAKMPTRKQWGVSRGSRHHLEKPSRR
jgi:hypothetical protein